MIMRAHSFFVLLTLALFAHLSVSSAFAARPKRSKSDKDINAIGRHKIAVQNLWLPEKEKERGKAWSIEFEKSARLVIDPAITSYVEGVATNILRNSDADMPIEVRVLDDDEVDACTLPGGYQYLTTGLLFKLESEGELASVLARGIAHTALRSSARIFIHGMLLQTARLPPALREAAFLCSSQSANFVLLTVSREDELDADYFGIQYLYKAGYDPESFLLLLQSVWGAPPRQDWLSPFPALPVRLKALRKEIVEILPSRETSIVSSSEFEVFRANLLRWRSDHPIVQKTSRPELVRHDTGQQ
jgi:beta-barrel assembly-enhancing protease